VATETANVEASMTRTSDWRAEAACRTVDPEIFFPVGSARDVERHYRAARAVCADCPVARQCLEAAVALDGVDGVWAGTTPMERDVLIARRVA
jgi:WhiB family redox-sensing transcriptional regulator